MKKSAIQRSQDAMIALRYKHLDSEIAASRNTAVITGPSFDVSPEASDLIFAVVVRFESIMPASNFNPRGRDRQDYIMDLTACHANGMPLDLAKLLAAPPFDLVHDVCGIRDHINRRTGKIEDQFVPRCAAL